jgi:hypothetical protein
MTKLVPEGTAGWDVYELPWPLLNGGESYLAELGEWFSRHDGQTIRITVEVVEPTAAGVHVESAAEARPAEGSG